MKNDSKALVRTRRTPEQAKALLAEQQRCGMTDEDFTTEHGIAPSTLIRWRRAYTSPTPRWIEVGKGLVSQSGNAMALVRLQDGVCIDLQSGFEVDSIAGLIERLRKG
jgi:hypothetical protein